MKQNRRIFYLALTAQNAAPRRHHVARHFDNNSTYIGDC